MLKDASATAIYGSRDANDVIIVKAKGGHRGEQTSVEFGYTVSIANPVKTYRPLNNAEYLAFQSETLRGAAAALKEQDREVQPPLVEGSVQEDLHRQLEGGGADGLDAALSRRQKGRQQKLPALSVLPESHSGISPAGHQRTMIWSVDVG
ncbi:hypothetical protein B5G09_11710 [Alistipes sp. An54]|uniref:hypothetical protein n=1 Tax=Alistipes sp. An54 TaxID=1965645 RepID=UPI000B3A7972|nr:hypothetical protein [Alistipes sp. An54]OUN76003.1 hypothetical protein B5G09_11710 [Alistipes sp. An54]